MSVDRVRVSSVRVSGFRVRVIRDRIFIFILGEGEGRWLLSWLMDLSLTSAFRVASQSYSRYRQWVLL